MSVNLHLTPAMKTNKSLRIAANHLIPTFRLGSWSLVILGSLLIGHWPGPQARAVIPEPDNLVYGIIMFETNLVTAQNTGVVVEARRTNGITVAAYRMGAQTNVGNFYLLSIKVEEMEPRRDPSAVLVNEVLSIRVSSNGVQQVQQNFLVSERGLVRRLDFGAQTTNGLSGYEAWAQAQGLGSNSGNLDADGDGFSNLDEYRAGTNPKEASSKFVLAISRTETNVQVSFLAIQAQGIGYEGQERYYFLESATNFTAGAWTERTYTLGENQSFTYSIPVSNASPAFFRVRAELLSP